ncbi:vitamin B12 biosynthesis CobS, cobalamin-5-phosphate synthase [Cladochytrium replicatum]|nr:vitamin B12 biosynthesis CobS, cobalamin-5-phosphate synthase [Cladochytrium replicatum]
MSHGHGSGHGEGHVGHSPPAQDSSQSDQKEHKVHSPTEPAAVASMSLFGRELRAFLASVMFFTRIPVPRWVSHNNYWLGLSAGYYPVIGVIVGLFGSVFFSLALWVWGDPWLAAVAYTMATVYLTGAFHEDGLSDMFDGFGGGWTREAIFRIMRDPRVGTYGVLGLTLCVQAKLYSVARLALQLLPPSHTPLTTFLILAPRLVSAHVLGRWSCSLLLHIYIYVENVSAEGKEFKMNVSVSRAAFAALSAWVIVAGAFASVGSFAREGWVVFGVAVGMTFLLGRYVNAKIGGVIGDCLGAINQIVELCTYLALVAVNK